MKKTLFTLVCLMMASVSMFAESAAVCLLQHGGSVQLFDADKIANAIKAAVDGDTLYLTAGSFSGFTIDKKITVRGAGQETKITGNITISISGTPTLTQTVLEGLNLISNSSVTFSTAMKGVKIKQCSMYELIVNANNSDVIIDRCNISSELRYSSYIKSMTVLNSYAIIGNYSSSENTIHFVNCNVYMYYPSNCAGTFINSVIGRSSSYGSFQNISNCSFVNCLFRWNANSYFQSSTTAQHCYYDSECSDDDATFEELGYLGIDGKVVGYMGGSSPYTLELSVPKVTESEISLDPSTRVLNVNIKASAK